MSFIYLIRNRLDGKRLFYDLIPIISGSMVRFINTSCIRASIYIHIYNVLDLHGLPAKMLLWNKLEKPLKTINLCLMFSDIIFWIRSRNNVNIIWSDWTHQCHFCNCLCSLSIVYIDLSLNLSFLTYIFSSDLVTM